MAMTDTTAPDIPPPGPPGAQPATAITRACQHAARRWLPLADTRSFDDARRGHVADLPAGAITRANGGPVWNLKAYGFLAEEEAPDSVHPGLWRHARVNMVTGLFKVCDRLYQVRGIDIANMTIIEGDTGLIVVDPLISTEVAAAALELYLRTGPRRWCGGDLQPQPCRPLRRRARRHRRGRRARPAGCR
jgi:alkyl sulfatase BDS1-like metallo-beta-lactamase superfamily hydrolase